MILNCFRPGTGIEPVIRERSGDAALIGLIAAGVAAVPGNGGTAAGSEPRVELTITK